MHVKNAGAGKRGYLTGNMHTWQGSGCVHVVDFLVTFFGPCVRSLEKAASCTLQANPWAFWQTIQRILGQTRQRALRDVHWGLKVILWICTCMQTSCCWGLFPMLEYE